MRLTFAESSTIEPPSNIRFLSICEKTKIKRTQKLPKISSHPLSLSFSFHCHNSSAIIFLFKRVNKMETVNFKTLTVNSPVSASKPTCTVCSKFVGLEMLGLESLCDCFDFILFLSVFFLRSGSSGSVDG